MWVPGRTLRVVDPWWALVVPAYLLGTFPTALLVGRREGRDPTTRARATRAPPTRCARWAGGPGALVLVGDLGKGALATGVGWALGGRAVGVACGLAAVVGHVAPVTRRFRGRQGRGHRRRHGPRAAARRRAVVLAVVWARGR